MLFGCIGEAGEGFAASCGEEGKYFMQKHPEMEHAICDIGREGLLRTMQLVKLVSTPYESSHLSSSYLFSLLIVDKLSNASGKRGNVMETGNAVITRRH